MYVLRASPTLYDVTQGRATFFGCGPDEKPGDGRRAGA